MATHAQTDTHVCHVAQDVGVRMFTAVEVEAVIFVVGVESRILKSCKKRRHSYDGSFFVDFLRVRMFCVSASLLQQRSSLGDCHFSRSKNGMKQRQCRTSAEGCESIVLLII